MTPFVVYDSLTGEIKRTGFVPDGVTPDLLPGETWLSGSGSITADYVDLNTTSVTARTVCDADVLGPDGSGNLRVVGIPIGSLVEMAGQLVPVHRNADGAGECELPDLGPGVFDVVVRHASIFPFSVKVQRPPVEV